jgi:hypothetical protein
LANTFQRDIKDIFDEEGSFADILFYNAKNWYSEYIELLFLTTFTLKFVELRMHAGNFFFTQRILVFYNYFPAEGSIYMVLDETLSQLRCTQFPLIKCFNRIPVVVRFAKEPERACRFHTKGLRKLWRLNRQVAQR